MKTKSKIRPNIARLLLLGFLVSSAALFVSAQVGSETKKGGKREPAPLSTAPYDVWTMEQLAKPGNLGNYGNPNHDCSVQRRNVGAAPESHDNFAHVLIFTSGSGSVNLGGEIVAGPDGKKIVQGGDRRKIVVGDVYHIPLKTVHWVVPDAGSTITYFVCNLYTAAP
jgi:mannose-6-phosphate isomerase-like protein (cupin superfamily)